MVDGKVARSPDHLPRFDAGRARRPRSPSTCAARAAMKAWPLPRTANSFIRCSKARFGTPTAKEWEKADGKELLRILEFSVADAKWTGRYWKFTARGRRQQYRRLQHDRCHDRPDHRARQWRRLEPTRPAPKASRRPTASTCRRKFKRVYKIELARCQRRGLARKIGYIDLMDIADPKKLRQAGRHGRQTHLPVRDHRGRRRRQRRRISSSANDNNFPYLGGPRAATSRTTTSSCCSMWPNF